MRSYILLIFSAMAIFTVGCEVFLVDGIGGDGEPCSGYGVCEPGLVCNSGICGPPVQEGEECDDLFQEDNRPVCESGLWCVDGICEPPTDVDVKQPNADLYWLLCPVSYYWNGWECREDSDFYNIMWFCDGETAQSACPSGYRLPTRSEMIVLLGGCSSDVLDGNSGFCDSCEESDNCSAMFERFNDYVFWTSTKDSAFYWRVDFSNGRIRSVYYDSNVRCVRSGG